MSRDQIIRPAVSTAVTAAAGNITPAVQSRISTPSRAGSLTEASLQALNETQPSGSSGPCENDTEVGSLFLRTADKTFGHQANIT
jgi:hypothetical protein